MVKHKDWFHCHFHLELLVCFETGIHLSTFESEGWTEGVQ